MFTRNTMLSSCLRSIMMLGLWLHSIRFVLYIRSVLLVLSWFIYSSGVTFTLCICAALQACGRFINNNAVTRMAQSSSKSPELLARYCDSLLKKRWILFHINVILVSLSFVSQKWQRNPFYCRYCKRISLFLDLRLESLNAVFWQTASLELTKYLKQGSICGAPPKQYSSAWTKKMKFDINAV